MIILHTLSEAIVLTMFTILFFCLLPHDPIIEKIAFFLLSNWALLLLLSLYPANVARKKGRNFYVWYFYSCALLPIAFLHARHIGKDIEALQKDSSFCQCPGCAEFADINDETCSHCGAVLPDLPNEFPDVFAPPFTKLDWLRNLVVVLTVWTLVYYFDPTRKVFLTLGGPVKDGGYFFNLTIGCIAALTASLISMRHYWKWIILASFGVVALSVLHDTTEGNVPYRYVLSVRRELYAYIFVSFISGLFCLPFSLSMANGVRVLRRMLWK